MNFLTKFTIPLLFSLLMLPAGCAEQNSETKADAQSEAAYVASIDQWHQQREANLKASDGWLTLSGLFCLEEGENTFGSAEGNDLVFPAGKIPGKVGVITLKGNQVTVSIRKGAGVQLNGHPVEKTVLFSGETDTVPQLTYGTLTWYVIKRADRYCVRLRDSENEALTHFRGIDRYPVKPDWRLAAKLEKHPTPKQIQITNIMGQTSQEDSPGTLVFKIEGEEYRLDALQEGDKLFIIFADQTNGHETYGAGRYIYADKPGTDGMTVLDFNKATNPPCAFVPYATCPLPPRQNFLSLKVPAGEKTYGEY